MRRPWLRRRTTIALAVVGIAVTAAAPAAARPAPGQVHFRGTVYSFDNQGPIAGATVRVAELPGRSATSAADGSYDLALPDGTKVTPYVEASGYRGIHLQSFVTSGADLEHVNFQIPTTGTYGALAAALGVEVDASGAIVRCAIVSTFSTVAVRDLSFEEFVAYGAHGVAGATASASPALPAPVYFNSSVIPDRSLTQSSVDGGVIWTEVPAGVYRVRARHPSTRFAEFTASCAPGRLVNANPPWGLRELRPGEPRDKRVFASVSSARAEPIGDRRRVVRVTTAADEYVAVAASVSRRGHELVATEPGKGVGEYSPGARRLSLELPRRPRRGSVRLEVVFTDGAGNELTETKRVRLLKRR